ncbi:MAG: CDP-archaeol synthase [Pseudomonadota bacterium]
MAQRFDQRELRLRLISAVALGIVSFLCLWLHQLSFAALVATLAVIMAWEWGRAVRSVDRDQCLIAHCAGLLSIISAAFFAPAILTFLVLLLATVAVFAVAPKGARTMSALGAVYIGIPAILVLWLRQDAEYGVQAILFVLVVVAAHDTFAMIIGKLVGGPRLWPVLSPNKTWSGVIGGLAASLLAGLLMGLLIEGNPPLFWLTLLGLVLGIAGLVGDLAESAFKRTYEIKNASGLVPGHGGILDRLDGLIVAITVAAIIGLGINSNAPGRALLFLE